MPSPKTDWTKPQPGWNRPEESMPIPGQRVDFVFRHPRWGFAGCRATYMLFHGQPAFKILDGIVDIAVVQAWRPVDEPCIEQQPLSSESASRRKKKMRNISPEERERRRQYMHDVWARKRAENPHWHPRKATR